MPQPQDVTEQRRDLAMATGVRAGQTTGQVHLQSSDPGKAIATYCVQVLDPCVHSIKHFSALGGGLWTGIDCGTKPSLRKREVRSIIYLIDFFFSFVLFSAQSWGNWTLSFTWCHVLLNKAVMGLPEMSKKVH